VATILEKRRVLQREPPDGRSLQCAACADRQLVELDDQVLYWPACGHGLDDDDALYDRPVCVRCEDAAGRQSGSNGIDGP
jgi:hypothetical protein